MLNKKYACYEKRISTIISNGVVGLAYAQMTAEIVLAATAVVVLIRLMKQMQETIAFRQAPQSQEADI